jgi:tripartite-type tricarboxylate transporter receptor subunit TctC
MTRRPVRLALARQLAYATYAVIASWAVPGIAQAAQPYPDRHVRLIVPYPAGGVTDVLARTIAQRISVQWGQQVVVDNRGGASGNIGMAIAARAPADGYTIAFGNAQTHAINASLFKSLPYDPIKDFAPITMVARVSNVLLVGPSFPARTLADVIAMAKAKPGQLTFASNGVGSSNHLTGELLKTMAGIDMVHVPYKTSTTAAIDLIGGRVALMFDNLTTAIPQIRANKMRPVAVTSERRVAELPEVPTIAESGLKGFVVTPWWGIFAPAGTPKPIIDTLNRDIVAVLHSKDVKDYLASQATEVVSTSPQEFAAYLKTEIVRWGKVVKASGATAE